MPTQELVECNFDGLVGPTHNYAGLSYGNLAATKNAGSHSNPKAAALQGLAKMRYFVATGRVQGFIAPHYRPNVAVLRRLGYGGSDASILARVLREDPVLLAQVSSSSGMWTANAATVSPSTDTRDGKLHLTPANLVSMFHRSIEPHETARILRAMFPDAREHVVHDPLPASPAYGDEGAANHTRLFADEAGVSTGQRGRGKSQAVHVFVFGAHHGSKTAVRPTKFPARQTLEASQAVARLHGLDPARVVFAQQNPVAIDSGAFHNDVVSVGTGRVLMYHQDAFVDARGLISKLTALLGKSFVPIMVPRKTVSLEVAVKTYLFNSQLVAIGGGRYELVAPIECQESPAVVRAIDAMLGMKNSPLAHVVFLDVRQSMRNGGGPACLRLRVPMTARDLASVPPGVLCNEATLGQLQGWIERWYPESLTTKDLADPKLAVRVRDALDALTTMFKLGKLYSFQD